MTYTDTEIQEMVKLHELWLVNRGSGKRADFSASTLQGYNLRGLDLREAIFRGANLCNVDMTDSILIEADFSGADLHKGNFHGANLSGANLRRVDAQWTDFSRSNLRAADIRYTNLRCADLSGSDLSGANLSVSTLLGVNLHRTILCWTVLSLETDLGDTAVIQLGPLGSRKDQLVVKRFSNGDIEAMTGCFRGTLDKLSRTVEETHAHHPQYLQEYRAAITYCRTVWGVFAQDVVPTCFYFRTNFMW